MRAREDDFARLAKALGVASSYLGQSEERVEITRETQAALMEALGFPAADAASVQQSLERSCALRQKTLPPWLVVEARKPATVKLPAGVEVELRKWRISGENGFQHDGPGARLDLPALEPGYYHLDVDAKQGTWRSFLIVSPRKCWIAPQFEKEKQRGWGLTAQAYGLRSGRNYGFGDFTDIADLARAAARSGASFLGLSPLHVLFPSDRSKISPYSPSSRLFIEPLYLDPGAMHDPRLDEGLRGRIQALRAAPLVNYREAWEVKGRLLESLFQAYTQENASHDFADKQATFGEELELHATFEALSEYFAEQGLHWSGAWPAEYHDSGSNAVERFRREHKGRIDFHAWLQLMCDEQFARAAQASDMEVGLYRDLAVGADRYGSEVWARPDRYALGLTVGAPPDPLGPQGQNWGFPPFNPITLEQQDFAAFRDLVVANMRHAGAIRIDHAFQLQRLFLVPSGRSAADGGYVEFPFEALLGILRIESQRRRCMVIAEDLGTGPKGFSERVMNCGILSYRILSFERTKDGGFVPPEDYPAQALAAITTHDLPTFKGWRRGFDIDLRAHFGVYSEEQARQEQKARSRDVRYWREALQANGLTGEFEPDHVARNEALTYLARTPCVLLAVQLEDILDDVNQANLPGLSEGPPNWRRRMSETIEHASANNGAIGKAGALMAEAKRTPHAREARLAGPAPRATYRLQFHAGFTFDMARNVLPYLKRLGISHVYASPIQKARKGSTHGYDVVDPREINPELGGRTAFDAFEKELHKQGLKLIIDIVPNHMGIGAENPFWNSVLQWGPQSPHAHVFDIDFERGGGRVMLPVLGRPYAEALEAGEVSLRFDATRGFFLGYFDQAFPVAPRCYAALLTQVTQDAGPRFRSALEALRPQCVNPRKFNAAWDEFGKCASGPKFESLVTALCESISSDPHRLDALLDEQAYRLAHWRLAGSDINYRRFFEINSLAGVRIEDENVMALTHELVFDLVDNGQVDGLRIDHIDGLADPELHLRRLQRRVGPGFYIVAEKILERGEKLKPWPISGTTGYDALNELDGIMFAREARAEFETFYREHVGHRESYAQALVRAKSFVLEHSFGGECDKLADGLSDLAKSQRETKDISRASLRRVTEAAIIELPIYRTYVGAGKADEADRASIAGAMERVRANARPVDVHACDFLENVLSGDVDGPKAARLRTSFEQLTGPVMAKGLEDTLFYRYAPFLALNEVGADPSHFGYSRQDFHAAQALRAREWPSSMITTTTHDTKRGEDARARLLALSARPELFLAQARRFLDLAHGVDRNDAYILLQSLVGAWPFDEAESASPEFRERARGFFLKAIREAKRHSSWTDPDEVYEQKAFAFLDAALSPGERRDIIVELAMRFSWPGALNSLARTILKLTLPGVPDFYPGASLWDFSFVDPDNRRPVDFGLRLRNLESSRDARASMLLPEWQDGRIKQWLTERLLAHRAETPDLYAFGDYEPRPSGLGVAFLRQWKDDAIFVCAPTGTEMMKRRLLEKNGRLCANALWHSEKLALAEGRWRNLLTGSAFAAQGAVTCAEISGGLPWLILGKLHE